MTYWRTSRQTVGGNQLGGSPYAQDTQRDSNVVQLHPLPAQSLRHDAVTDETRSNIAGIFAVTILSIGILVPLILAGIASYFG